MKVTKELLEALGLEMEGNRYINKKNGYFVYLNKIPNSAKELVDSMFGFICKTCSKK